MNINLELFIFDLKEIIEKTMYDRVEYNRRFGKDNQCYGLGQNEIPKISRIITQKINDKYDLNNIKHND